ncbi:MAG: CoA transferase [Actinomycetota bacterium]
MSHPTATGAQPLAGITVVELATGVAGPYAGKLLADYGADVVKVEPPGGDPARREGARIGERPEPEASPVFLHLNTNKRSVVADLGTAAGRALVDKLVARADVVIESWSPAEHAALGGLGLSVEQWREANPRLVVTSVTPWGLSGPMADEPGSEIALYAVGGPMLATGEPDREPLKMAGSVVQMHAGSVAALATLGAVAMAEASGVGTRVEVANVETQAASIDRRAPLLIGYQFDGEIGPREGGGRVGAIPAGVYPCDDGYCQVVFAPSWMPRVAEMLGDEELIERVVTPDWLDDDEVPELLNAALFTWSVQLPKQQTMLEAQERQLAITPINTTTDVLADPHFRARGFWQQWTHPVVGTYESPGAPFRFGEPGSQAPAESEGSEGSTESAGSGPGWVARRRPPLLGEHTAEVTAEVDHQSPLGSWAGRPAASGSGAASPTLPLDGVRVLDLAVVWAGPQATTLLGDLGAEVIRLDNPNLFPTATRGAVARPPEGRVREMGAYWGRYPGGDGGERPWNRVGAFVCHARGKLGATIDLRTDLGRETFLDLVEQSDVIVENNSVKVLPSLGLGWDVLHARNPRLIVARMPSLGLEGPYAHYVGFGAHMEALGGLSSLRGYQDLDLTSLDPAFFMDPASGVTAAFAVLCAVRRRSATGLGELIEFAQAENLLNYIGDYFVDASITGAAHECHGNRHPHRAPQGAYPCVGHDAWVVLSVPDDEAWAALVAAMGSPTWATDDRFATEAGRRAHHDELDGLLAGWTAERTVEAVMAAWRPAGVSVAAALNEPDLLADAHLGARAFWRPNASVDVPEVLFPGHQWRWDGPDLAWGPLNRMGAENAYVYRELLGLDDEGWAGLDAEGHLADGYRDPDGRLV